MGVLCEPKRLVVNGKGWTGVSAARQLSSRAVAWARHRAEILDDIFLHSSSARTLLYRVRHRAWLHRHCPSESISRVLPEVVPQHLVELRVAALHLYWLFKETLGRHGK